MFLIFFICMCNIILFITNAQNKDCDIKTIFSIKTVRQIENIQCIIRRYSMIVLDSKESNKTTVTM